MKEGAIKHDWSVEDYAEYRKKLVRESQRRRRARAKENGMCPMCCVRPARKGKTTCEECGKYAKDYAKWRKGRGKEK